MKSASGPAPAVMSRKSSTDSSTTCTAVSDDEIGNTSPSTECDNGKFALVRHKQGTSSCLTASIRRGDLQPCYRTRIIEIQLEDWFGTGARLNGELETNVLCWSKARRTPMEKSTSVALCLFHLGSTTGDRQILMEAWKHYAIGLQLALDTANMSDLRVVLNTACKLLTCELYNECANATPTVDSFDGHVRGITSIIKASERSARPNNLSAFQLQHFRFKTVMRSLVCRRAVVSEDVWISCSKAPLPQAAESLVQLAIRLVLLLDRVSSFSRASSSHEVSSVQSQLIQLQSAYSIWLSSFRISQETRQPPPSATLTLEHKETSDCMCKSGSISHDFVLEDLDPLNQCYYSFYLICELVLRETLLNMSAICPQLAWQRDLIAEIDNVADGLCQIIEMETSKSDCFISKALRLRAHFHFLTEWFERSNSTDNLRWVQVRETWLRSKVPFMNWDAVLWFSFHAISWLEQYS